MTNAVINRIISNAGSPDIPVSCYTCNSCGYKNITLNNNYCPNCGNKIDKFFTFKQQEKEDGLG